LITVIALLSNVMLSWAFFRGPGLDRCDPLGVVLALVSLALLLAGALVTWPPRIESAAARLTPRVLVALVVLRMAAFTSAVLKEGRDGGYSPFLTWPFLLVTALAIASYRWGFLLWPRARLPVLLAIGMTPPLWIIRSQPKPSIDVITFEEEASRLLLSGHNPYAADHAIPGLDPHVYGPRSPANEKIMWYPYTPVNMLAMIPGYLLGDVRYATLAALVGVCALLCAGGRRAGLPAGSFYELIVVLLCLQVDNHFIIRFGWTEPFLALGVAGCAYSLAAGRGGALGLSVAWTAAVKQYGFLWTIPVVASGRLRSKDLAVGLLAALALTVPFFAWGPRDFLEDTVFSIAREPFRSNMVSVPALYYSMSGRQVSSAWSFVAAAVVAAVVILQRRPVPPPRVILGGTVIALAFVAFSTHGVPNFYWFTGVAPLAAAVLQSAGAEHLESGKE
jgi:hypothetical protein